MHLCVINQNVTTPLLRNDYNLIVKGNWSLLLLSFPLSLYKYYIIYKYKKWDRTQKYKTRYLQISKKNIQEYFKVSS